MAYSVLDIKTDLEGVIHGTTANQIQNLDGLIYRAARQVLLDIDPQETKRVVEFVAPIFESVYDYPIAEDVKGNRIADIRPQVRRLPRDVWSQQYNQAFDVYKSNLFTQANMFTMNFDSGLKTIRVNAPYLNAPVIVNQIEGIQLNGTWATGGTASNLSVNNSNFVQGSGSLQFDVTAGTAYIENSTMTAVNLSATEDQSSFFCYVYVPAGSSLTSANLRIGSSASDYWTLSVTQTQQGTAFQSGWNLCQFQWASMSSVGSPDASSVGYARISLAVTGTMAGCKANGLDSILGTVLEYEYYSKYMFRDAVTGAFQERVTDDSNLINLDTETYNILFNKVAELAVQQQQGSSALQFDGSYFAKAYADGVAKYKLMYKSEVQKPQTTYYAKPDKGYSNYLGTFYNG